MKSFFNLLFLLLTIILLFAYSIGLTEKIQRPTFKNLPSSDYVWLGILLFLMVYLNIKWLFSNRRKVTMERITSTTPAQFGAIAQTIKQYDVFLLAKDLNPKITKGMQGVILEIWDDNNFEIEFAKKDGTNFNFKGETMFTVDQSFIGEIIWTTPK